MTLIDIVANDGENVVMAPEGRPAVLSALNQSCYFFIFFALFVT